jgi:hypothetical protein
MGRNTQQLRDVFPGDGPHRFILFDHDSTFDRNVTGFMKATGLDPTRTGIQAPWQNGVAERWVGSCRRELLDSNHRAERTPSLPADPSIRGLLPRRSDS